MELWEVSCDTTGHCTWQATPFESDTFTPLMTVSPSAVVWDSASLGITYETVDELSFRINPSSSSTEENSVIAKLVDALNKAGIDCEVSSNSIESLVAALKAREGIKADAKALDEFLNSFSNSETT